MTVLSVVRSACLVLGYDQPDVLMSSTDREYAQLARLVNDTARMIAEDYDWQILQKVNTFTGNGSSEEFDLPDDYDRMSKSASMWSSRWSWSFNHISDTNQWLESLVTPFNYINGNWTIFGGQFHFLPVMSSTENIRFFYVSKMIVASKAGVFKETFTDDDDVFRLNERLLELGIIWRSKKDNGVDFTAAKAEYDDLLLKRMKSDGGSQGVVSGNLSPYRRGVKTAFPYTVGG